MVKKKYLIVIDGSVTRFSFRKFCYK